MIKAFLRLFPYVRELEKGIDDMVLGMLEVLEELRKLKETIAQKQEQEKQ